MAGGEAVHSGDKSIWMLDGVIFTILTDNRDTILTYKPHGWIRSSMSWPHRWRTSCSPRSSASSPAQSSPPRPPRHKPQSPSLSLQVISPLFPWIFPAICFDLPDLPNLSAALVIWVKSIIHGCAVRSLEGSTFPWILGQHSHLLAPVGSSYTWSCFQES